MMNPLPYLAFAACAAGGVGWWQQHSIDRVQGDIARLAQEIVAVRDATEVERASLKEARSQLSLMEARLQSAQAGPLDSAAGAASSPTPADEGWWPENQPYFYLAKRFLPLVRFRNHALNPEEIDPKTRARMADGNWFTPEVGYRLFKDGGLNPHMALLLGMSEEETARVNDLWAALVRDSEALEAARIERVDPPQPAEPARPGELLVARLPALSAEMEPLHEQLRGRLEEILGPNRAAVLQEHLQRHANECLDGFGSLAREFLYHDDFGDLQMRYVDQGGLRMYGGHTSLGRWNNFGKYGHLFGPGAPCELKSALQEE